MKVQTLSYKVPLLFLFIGLAILVAMLLFHEQIRQVLINYLSSDCQDTTAISSIEPWLVEGNCRNLLPERFEMGIALIIPISLILAIVSAIIIFRRRRRQTS